jgi:ABC-2 type transport system permease protein
MTAIRTALADSILMTGRTARLAIRDSDSLIMAVALPVILMVMFVYVFGGAIAVPGTYLDYVAPGIILVCAGFGASGTAVAVAGEVNGAIMERFRSMPIALATVLSGHVVVSLLKNLVTTTVVFGVAFLLGFRPDAAATEWLAAIGLILMYVLAITWVSTLVGVLVRSVEAAAGFTFFILFLPYVSSAFVDPATMPSWMRGFAERQPVTPVIDTVRGLLTGTGTGSWPAAVAWSVGFCVVFAVAAGVAFARRVRR